MALSFWYTDTEIDECAINNGNCTDFADCINVQGSFTCTCWDGFVKHGDTCIGKLKSI